MSDLQREYVEAALDAVAQCLPMLPNDIQRRIKLAQSVLVTYGSATTEELRRELGANWVIARRTKSIVEKYGEDVRCYTSKQFDEAVRRAIESRF